MAEKIVTVDIDKDGNMSIDMAGFKGQGCKAVAKAFEEAGKVKSETLKPEFYQNPDAGNKVSAGG
jgi:hypothetical protein